jgi:AcrR family transcriptional regulator
MEVLPPFPSRLRCVSTSERPLRRDASRNRERVLQAARELFAERGLEVTMDEIARHAGVGVATAYRRFGHRDELIGALFEERMHDYVALAEASLAAEDPWEGLAGFLRGGVAMQAADRGLKDLLMSHSHSLERVIRVREGVLPLIEQLVARAHAAGALRPDVGARDLPMVSLMLGQVIDFSGDQAPELWRRYLALLLDGLRAEGGRAELPGAPLTTAQLDAAMSAWRPRRR